MTWSLTMLVVHLAVLGALLTLLRGGPDALQSIVVGLLLAAQAALVYHYLAEAISLPTHWQVKAISYSVEHIGVLLYVFRLFLTDQERRCLPMPSTQPSSSRR